MPLAKSSLGSKIFFKTPQQWGFFVSPAYLNSLLKYKLIFDTKGKLMYVIIAFILLFAWLVGLSNNMIGSYANVFLFGALLSFLAHYLGNKEPMQWR